MACPSKAVLTILLLASSAAGLAAAGAVADAAAFLAKAEVQAASLTSPGLQKPDRGLALLSVGYTAPEINGTKGGAPAPAFGEEDRSDSNMAYCLCAFVITGLSPALVQSNRVSSIVIFVYLASLTLVQVCVKRAVQHDMPYPYSIALLHMLTSAVISAAWERPRVQDALRVLPISAMDSLSLVLGNMALMVGGMPLAAKLSCCTPASTVMVEELRGRQCAPVRVLVVVALVVLGGMLCIKGSAAFAAVPLLLAVVACTSRSLKCVWEYELLEAEMPPTSLVAWSCLWSSLLLLPLVLYFEGTAALASFTLAGHETQLAVAASALLGMALHISQCLAIQQLGPLMQSTLLNVHYVLAVLSASAWFQEEVSTAQAVGTVVLVVGALLLQTEPASFGKVKSGCASLSELLSELC